MVIKRILVPIDFSNYSLNALAQACGLAEHFGAALVLLHVIEPIHFITESDVYAEQRRASTAQLTRLRADLEKKGHRVRLLIRGGIPSRVIVEAARSNRADLIVMGTHGRTGLAHLLIGSVAEKVVRVSACPVLTVRPARARKRTAKKAVGRLPAHKAV
jgi:universal stress protein A